MAVATRDLTLLQRILDVFESDFPSPAFRLEHLYRQVFANELPGGRMIALTDPSKWESGALVRAVDLIQEIVIHYVREYQDPRVLPVTHYKRQKRLAIHL